MAADPRGQRTERSGLRRDTPLSSSPLRRPTMDFLSSAIGATVGVGVALVGIPAGICALGFTGAGIAAGSVAAKMMSAAAIANNGAVAAGSTVAVLQSIGAAGLSLGAKVGLTSAMGSLGAVIGGQLFDGGDGSE
ncbi:interferon alpha-inducible protein 27-like protein 1 isoform 4-T4 [Chlamydotis macqueenii]